MAGKSERSLSPEGGDRECRTESWSGSERKLTRAEQLELWKKRRQEGGGKSAAAVAHTSECKQRSLQGLSSSQVNQRTSGGVSRTKPSPVGGLTQPGCFSSRKERSGSRSINTSLRSRASLSGSHHTSIGSPSDEEYGTSSREQSVECELHSSIGHSSEKRRVGDFVEGTPAATSISCVHDAISSADKSRRFSVHVAVDEDDDEVEWRVPASGDSVPAHRTEHGDKHEEVATENEVDGKDTAEAPSPTNLSYNGAGKEDVISELSSGQVTEAGEREDELSDNQQQEGKNEAQDESRTVDQSHSERRRRDSIFREDDGSGVLVAASFIRDTEAHQDHVEVEEGEEEGEEEEGREGGGKARLSNLHRLQRKDEGKEVGRMSIITEAWMEDEGGEEDDVTMADVRSKLFDTTSRLARSTSLLQRMVEENTQLRAEVTEFQGYKNKYTALEKSITDLHSRAPVPGPSLETLYQRIQPPNAFKSTTEDRSHSKRPAESSSPAAMGEGTSKRLCLSPCKNDTAADAAGVACESMIHDDAHHVPVEMCMTVLRARLAEREQELKRLRTLLAARENEFTQERKNLVAKLMASEQERRESEAALETNDAMWQQLMQNQMAQLQQRIAAQAGTGAHGQPEEAEASCLEEGACSKGFEENSDVSLHVQQLPRSADNDEGECDLVENAEEGTGQGHESEGLGHESEGLATPQDHDANEMTESMNGEEVEGGSEEGGAAASAPPMSPASALMAKWSSRRRTSFAAGATGH